jgi:hypothetical protein
VFEHPERPPQHTIENDSALDIWVEEQQRKDRERRAEYIASQDGSSHGKQGKLDGREATQADFEGGKTIELSNPNPQKFVISEDPDLI